MTPRKDGAPAEIPIAVVLSVSVAARALFVALADPRAVSADMHSWTRVAAALAAGQNPYNTTGALNWPPFWMQIVFALHRTASAAGVGFIHAVQAFLIAAECGLLLATDRLMGRLGVRRRRLLLLAGIAANPICVLLVCQHGSFDVLVALAVVLFVTWLLRFLSEGRETSWLMASLFLGAGIALKEVPAVLFPLLCSGVRRVCPAARSLGALLLFGPAVYGLSILYVLGPNEITRNVFSYRSVPGWFGVTGVFHLLRRDDWTRAYSGVFPIALALALSVLAASLWRARPLSAREAVLWCVALLVAVPFLGSGYGPQYIYWFWPLLLVVAAGGSLPLRVAAAAFALTAAVTYVIQYALFEVLGAFLTWKAPSSEVSLLSMAFRSFRAAALLNTPLFVCYAALFIACLVEIARLRRSRESGGPETGAKG